MPKNNKAKHPAKAKQPAKPKPHSSTTVNRPVMKEVAAPAAVGVDMQTYFKETPYKHKCGDEIKDAICVEGCEYLGPVQVPEDEVAGAVYEEFYLSPGEFAGTRLSSYAKLYEKFLFLKSEFAYVPGTSAEADGLLVIAYDRDISDDTPPANQQGVRQFLAMEDAKSGNVWTPHVAKCPLRAPETGFYTNPVTDGDDRLSYQGQVYVACILPTGRDPGASLGALLVRYKCIFFIPQLEGDLEQLVQMDDGLAATLNNSSVDVDLLAAATVSSPAIESDGTQAWVPKLQGDGTYAIKLVEGLYNYMASVSGGTANNAMNATMSNPTLEPLVPANAPAPQPQVQAYLTGNGFATVGPTAFTSNPGVWMGYLNVPKGGALLRQVVTFATSLVSTLTAGVAAYNILRMGGAEQGTLPTYPSPVGKLGKLAKKLGVVIRPGESVVSFIERVAAARLAAAGRAKTVLAGTTGYSPVPLQSRHLCVTPEQGSVCTCVTGGNAERTPPVGVNGLVDRERR